MHNSSSISDLSPAFWAGKKVFLTGHTGFKGSWLALWLRELGAEVTGFSLPEEDLALPDLGGLAGGGLADHRGFSPDIRSFYGDIRDYAALDAALCATRPEIVFHLAAQPLVRASYLDPLGTYAVNAMGTANLLQAVRACGGVRSVVVITTDKCYADQQWPWGYRENDRLGGHDPYSSSKACAELVTAAFRASYFAAPDSSDVPAIATARAGNVIGGGDWAVDRLIPDIVRALAAGEPVRIRRPEAVRPWQHVLDPLAGYLALAERAAGDHGFAVAWNFGPDDGAGHSVRWMTEQFGAAWGGALNWVFDADPHPHETALLRLDSSLARQRLGWRPRLDTSAAVAWTAGWYRRYSQGEKPLKLCLEQIQTYMKRN